MTLVRSVPERWLPVARLEPVIGRGRYERLITVATRLRSKLGERTIWNINSTAAGGGVAEMLQVLTGYMAGFDVRSRWVTIGGDSAFFGLTKRLHNQLHGADSLYGPLGAGEARHYEEVLAANAAELLTQVRAGDITILHDPQTAGLAQELSRAGAQVLWRCHIGIDEQNDISTAAWEFLRPYLAAAQTCVFTHRHFAPAYMPLSRVCVIPPSIDPFSPKNVELDTSTVHAILATIGICEDRRAGQHTSPAGTPPRAMFKRQDGTLAEVTRPAMVTADARPTPDDQVVVQISRWDRLKDMAGVMRGFVDYAPASAYLILAGPATSGVADDPEGAVVFAECLAQWHELPARARARVQLVALPMDDVDENAAMVNALQRCATVIVQKSLAEGFGLTVAEAMWKGRPVIGSAVGGIADQIPEGTGILLPDPSDLADFGAKLRWLLDHPAEAEAMGAAGQLHTKEHFIDDLHLLRFAELIEDTIG